MTLWCTSCYDRAHASRLAARRPARLLGEFRDEHACRRRNIQSDFITHDGIDIVDGTDVTIQNSAVRAGDDAMCLKTGVRRGIDMLTVRDSIFSGNNGGSNGIKFGTGSYGAFKNITIEDSYVKDVQYAAIVSGVEHVR